MSDNRKVYRDALNAYEEGSAELQHSLSWISQTIGQLQQQDSSNPSIGILERSQDELHRIIDDVDKEMERCRRLASGESIDGNGDQPLSYYYRGVRRLMTAMHMYLMYHSNGQKVKCTDMANALSDAGVTVQVRNGQNRGQRRPVNVTHIRITAKGLQTAYTTRKKGISPFGYDRDNDEIWLLSPEEIEQAEATQATSTKERKISAPSATAALQ